MEVEDISPSHCYTHAAGTVLIPTLDVLTHSPGGSVEMVATVEYELVLESTVVYWILNSYGEFV